MKHKYLFYLLFATCNFLFGQSGYYIPGPSQPFNYNKYREVLLNSAPLNDTIESGQKREVMRMDDMYGNSIISHGDMGAIFFSKNSIVNCGPNAVTDKTWSEIGPNLNNKNTLTSFENAMGIGPVSFITFDPDDENIMFTGSWSSGLFYSADKGQNWQNAGTDKFNNVSAAYCVANKKSTPSSPKAWFMATGHGHGHGNPAARISDGIFRSFDNGVNWELIGDYIDLQSQHWAPPSRPSWNFQITKLATDYNNENILFATTQSGIMKTNDALSANPTWTKVYPTSGVQAGHEYLCNDITFLPIANSPLNVNSNILFATVTDHWATTVGSTTTEHFNTKFIYSKDGGINWIEVPGTSTITNPTVKINFEISVSNPNTIYIYELISNMSANLYKYTYSFDSNFNMTSPSINFVSPINTKYGWDYDFAIDNTDENHILHGDIYRVNEMHLNLSSTSTYLGSNVTHDDCQQLVFSPHDNSIWAGTHGGVYCFNNITNLWETKNNGLGNAMCYKVDNNTNKTNSIAVALDHNGSHVSNTKPYTTEGWNDNWVHFNEGDGLSVAYDKNTNIIYGSAQYGYLARYNENTNSLFSSSVTYKSTEWNTILNSDDENCTGYLYSNGVTNDCNLYRSVTNGVTPYSNLTSFQTTYFPSHTSLSPVVLWRHDFNNNYGIIAPRMKDLGDGKGVFKIFLTNNIKDPSLTNIVNSWWELNPPVGANNTPTWLTPYTDIDGNLQNDKDVFISSVCANSNSAMMYMTYSGIQNLNTTSGFKNKVFQINILNWTTHNATVKDITYNLPNVSVSSSLTYNANGVTYLFIGTDKGVFYTTENIIATASTGTEVWSCYGTNLPNVSVTTMVANPCSGTLRVGTFGRGIWEIALPDAPDLISVNTTINTTVTYKSHVIVKTGATLTINTGGNVLMRANRLIIVEKGAKLVINGGVVNSSCGNTWLGIEVQGDQNQKQILSGSYYPNHGWCVITNNGTIKNAVVGIKNFVSVNYDGHTIDWVKLGGGVIQCTNAKIENCMIGVRFLPYTNKNALNQIVSDMSFLTTTQFLTDAATAVSNFIPEAHVSMWGTRGIGLTSNTFKNNTPSSYSVSKRGIGLVTWDATFTTITPCLIYSKGGCSSYGVPNTFENLFYGVDAGASVATAIANINVSKFTNNHRSIILRGTTQSSVFRNTINIGEAFTEPTGVGTAMAVSYPYGLYLDACDAYNVKENIINDNTNNAADIDYGIIVSNTGVNANMLKQNTFSNVAYGIQAQEENYALQLKCNKFTAATINSADVKVMGLQMQGSIAQQQGLCNPLDPTQLPGNEFSHTCGSAKDLNSNGNVLYQVTYNTRGTVSQEVPQSGCYNTTDFNVNLCGNPPSGVVCAPPTGGHLRMAQNNASQQLQNMSNLIAAKQQLLADADAQSLYTSIHNGTPETTLKQNLMQVGPYLSDNILLAFLNHNPKYSYTTLKDVIIANSPVTESVMAAINQLSLPNMIKNQIMSSQTGISQRKYVQNEIKYYTTSRVLLYNDIINDVLNDSTNTAVYDTLYTKLDFIISPQSRNLYIGALMEQGKFGQAQAQIAIMRQTGETTENCDYLEAVLTLKQQANKAQAYKINASISSKINPLLSKWPLGKSVNANVLNSALFGKGYKEQIYMDKSSVKNQRLIAEEQLITPETELQVIAFPNPANTDVNFVIDGIAENEICAISIYDINGRLMTEFNVQENKLPKSVSLSTFSSGIYFYKAITGDKIYQNKLVIIK